MDFPNVRSARELLEIDYGVSVVTQPRESDPTVGTTAVKLGTYANSRLGFYLSNNGANPIYIGFSPGVTAGAGIQVAAGGFFSTTWRMDGELVNSEVWAISGAAGNSVHVVESVLSY